MLRHVRLVGLCCLLAGGCAGGGKMAPVSGVVTLNGKPVADVDVTFQPTVADGNNNPGPMAAGTTDSNGHYTLSVLGEKVHGATVGKNQVRFSPHVNVTDTSDEGLKKAKPTASIPARYWSDSKIEFDVPRNGTSSADFQLTSP
jgi:hypothetical protein